MRDKLLYHFICDTLRACSLNIFNKAHGLKDLHLNTVNKVHGLKDLYLNIFNKNKLFFLFIIFWPLSSFGEEKVLDLGEIEITGEVRRPNINLIYSKKYMNQAMALIAKKELKKFEKELLRPAENLILKRKPRKNPGSLQKKKLGGSH